MFNIWLSGSLISFLSFPLARLITWSRKNEKRINFEKNSHTRFIHKHSCHCLSPWKYITHTHIDTHTCPHTHTRTFAYECRNIHTPINVLTCMFSKRVKFKQKQLNCLDLEHVHINFADFFFLLILFSGLLIFPYFFYFALFLTQQSQHISRN